MVKYIFNGIELAAFPAVDTATYPHSIVLDIAAIKSSDFNYDYAAIFCSDPFTYGIGLLNGEIVETIDYPASATCVAYACRTDSTSWTKVRLTSSGDTTAEYVAVPSGSVYVWTSHDIINKDTGAVQYQATEIEQRIFADTPTISTNLLSEYTTLHGNYADTLRVEASVRDTGILTYQWYIVGEESDLPTYNATSNFFMPQTNEVGVHQYYCIVTNTYEEYTAQTISNVATVTVYSLESITPKKTINQLQANLGWIVGKCILAVLSMDSVEDDATVINGVLHIFNANATLTDTNLEVI